MNEEIFEYDACGMGLNFYLIHRFISKGFEATGIRENEFIIVSHPLQTDMLRALMVSAYSVPEVRNDDIELKELGDSFTNPLLRVKEWLSEPSLPPSEIIIETPRGRGRLTNLSVIGL